MKKNTICVIILGIIAFGFLIYKYSFKNASITSKTKTGIKNYNKDYYIKEYGGDLDSNLSIFPDNISNMIDSSFESSFKTGLFDSYGYLILNTKYGNEDYYSEIDRLSKINMTIKKTCYANSPTYFNYIKYDDSSYKYPSYITIDGFANTYEYALLNEKDFEITYIYVAYPNEFDIDDKYLKNDKSEYSKSTLNGYSMYAHSFDNDKSYAEFDDC